MPLKDCAMKGCGRVYHLAGLVSRQPADHGKMMALHVDGTRVVLEAARRHGLERAVVASSSGTIAVSRDAREHDENSGYKEKDLGTNLFLICIYLPVLLTVLLYYKD
jgi:nucleoside-diphosphate-sugar epimerase